MTTEHPHHGRAASGVHGRLVEVPGRTPRGEVTGAAVSRGFLRSNLTISFADGGTWEFEVSPFTLPAPSVADPAPGRGRGPGPARMESMALRAS